MGTDRPVSPDRVPTLTEVVQMPAAEGGPGAPPTGRAGSFVDRRAPQAERRANWPPPPAPPPEDQLTEKVLLDVQRQLDLMLETRMRETLAPALTRATDTLVREMRHELASTLRDVVARAVAQELARHRRR
jgi:hypothetical protein